MGTALTEHHLRLLQQSTKKVILVFDPDPAGIRAVQRTLDLFLSSGFEARAAILPQGEDPDTAIRKMGAERFQEYVTQAPLLLDFIRERIIAQYDLSQNAQRIQCANHILPTIVKIQNIPERNNQIKKTADLLNVTEADKAILEEFRKVARTGKPHITAPIPKKHDALPPVERYLLEALLKEKSLISFVKKELEIAELTHPVSRKIVQELFIYNDKTDFEAKILELLPHILASLQTVKQRDKGTIFDEYLHANLELLINNAYTTLTTLSEVGVQQMPQMVIHCDFHPGNLKFEGDQVTALFDFDWSKVDYRCFDVGLALFYFFTSWEAEDGQFRLEEASLFLKAYQETLMNGQAPEPLDTNELKYLAAMLNAANIYVLNWTIEDFYNKTVNPQEYLPFLAHAVEFIRWLDRNDHAGQLNEMISETIPAGSY